MQQQTGIIPTAPEKQAKAVIGSSNDSGISGEAVFTQDGD